MSEAAVRHCIPQEILTEVVKARESREGHTDRTIRCAGKIKGVDFCDPDLVQARVEVCDDAWEVTALFRITVRLDTDDMGDRTIRTMAFYRARIPFPVCDPPVDCRHLKARVDITHLKCHTEIEEHGHAVEVKLTFNVTVYALQSEVITVCRLPEHHG